MGQNLLFAQEPQRLWVFVVGTLTWQHADLFGAFPQQQRRDAELVALFRSQGVPEGHIVYLHDKQATMAQIQPALEGFLSRGKPGDLLFLYYCGHGYRADSGAAYFASYEADGDAAPGWPVAAIADTVARHFHGARALLVADCCYSGSLADAISAHSNGLVAFACLASSLASELSTGNWTFSDALLAGLRGEAVVDSDGSAQITLQELADRIAQDMAFAEDQRATFTTAGGFDPQLAVAPALPRPHPRVGECVAVQRDDGWIPAAIVAARGQQFQVRPFSDNQPTAWVNADSVRAVTRPTYPIGAAVEVQWKQRWYLASVVDVQLGIHCIQYDGYSSEWNEWVSARRIRPLL